MWSVNMVKVSIVVPVYNACEYLKTCLDSLVNQTIDDMEIIAIDDASLDNSLDILKDYAKNYSFLKVYSNKKIWVKAGLEIEAFL